MSSGWSLLRYVKDWNEYRQATALHYKLGNPDGVDWGPGPNEYPCLVASYPYSQSKVLGCYIYPEDALHLLQATGRLWLVPPGLMPAPVFTPPPAQQPPAAAAAQPLPTEADHFRFNTAHLLTFASIMIDTGIIRPEQFLERFDRFLALVDREDAERRRQAMDARALLEKLKTVE